ncbi:MAG: hypothetical protein K0Q74_1416 [Gammaproteobacteria bacterium]|nr:hypothetical protein [Gammaproteobacteria bacterium]
MNVCKQGNTLTEYSIVLGMICVIGLLSVKTLGNSIFSNLDSANQSEQTMMKMATLDFSSGAQMTGTKLLQGNVPLKGKGYYTVTVDLQTGYPSLQITDNNSGSARNATSIEGNEWNTLGSFHLADTLTKLAASQSDPQVSEYIQKLARLSYLAGGAEGKIDGLSAFNRDLEVGNSISYGNIDAYNDIKAFKEELKVLMNTPPAQMSPDLSKQVLPLAIDVYNIAHNYVQALAPFSKSQNQDFYISPPAGKSHVTEMPGQALVANSSQITYEYVRPRPVSITDLMSDEQLSKLAKDTLTRNDVSLTEPVQATWTDAVTLERTTPNLN